MPERVYIPDDVDEVEDLVPEDELLDILAEAEVFTAVLPRDTGIKAEKDASESGGLEDSIVLEDEAKMHIDNVNGIVNDVPSASEHIPVRKVEKVGMQDVKPASVASKALLLGSISQPQLKLLGALLLFLVVLVLLIFACWWYYSGYIAFLYTDERHSRRTSEVGSHSDFFSGGLKTPKHPKED